MSLENAMRVGAPAAFGPCASGYQCGPDGLCYKMGQAPKPMPDLAVTMDMTMACTQASCKAPNPICDPDSQQCVACLKRCGIGHVCILSIKGPVMPQFRIRLTAHGCLT